MKFADIPSGLAALPKVPGLGWLRTASGSASGETQQGCDTDAKNEPGKVGWKPLLRVPADPETRERGLNAENANGRLARVAVPNGRGAIFKAPAAGILQKGYVGHFIPIKAVPIEGPCPPALALPLALAAAAP